MSADDHAAGFSNGASAARPSLPAVQPSCGRSPSPSTSPPYILRFLRTLTLRFRRLRWWLTYVLIRDALLFLTRLR